MSQVIPMCKVCGKAKGRIDGYCKLHHPQLILAREEARQARRLYNAIDSVRSEMNELVAGRWILSKIDPVIVFSAMREEIINRKKPVVLSILYAPDENMMRDKALNEIAIQVQSWLDWQEQERIKEKLSISEDTHLMRVPVWPSRGQLKEWVRVLKMPNK